MSKVLDIVGLEGGYGSVQILYGIDLYVDEGEFVTIIGPNGCGKSTFLKVLFGLATYSRGTVLHKSADVSGWRTDRLVGRGIAYVPQVDNVFPSLSVRENLQMGGVDLPTKQLTVRIDRACDMFPELVPRMNDLAASLSGGERQRVAIARALVTNPKCVLLDEPTGNLDRHTALEIQQLMSDLNESLSTSFIVVTHDERLADSMQRILVLSDGGLKESATQQSAIPNFEVSVGENGVND